MKKPLDHIGNSLWRCAAALALIGAVSVADAAGFNRVWSAPKLIALHPVSADSVVFSQSENDEILASIGLTAYTSDHTFHQLARFVIHRYEAHNEWSQATTAIEFGRDGLLRPHRVPSTSLLEYAGQHRWILSWFGHDGNGWQYALSDDNGVTWSTPYWYGNHNIAVAGNGEGTLLLNKLVRPTGSDPMRTLSYMERSSTEWQEYVQLTDAYLGRLLHAGGTNWVTSNYYWSADNGFTWKLAPPPIHDPGASIGLATDGEGTVLSLTHRRHSFSYESVFFMNKSDDYGRTWKATALFEDQSVLLGSGDVISVAPGVWIAAWTVFSNRQPDIHTAVSHDNGETWQTLFYRDTPGASGDTDRIPGDSPTLARSGTQVILGYINTSNRAVYRAIEPLTRASAADWQLFE